MNNAVSKLSTKRKNAILVLGMHRSGTSALSGVLALLGARAPRHLMAADEGNPKGYWESTRFVELHDRLLAAHGGEWRDWWKLDIGESAAASDFLRQFPSMLAKEFGEAETIVVKDPRICRFVPLWLRGLSEAGWSPAVLMPVRNPLEVMHSLRLRHSMSEAECILLWLRYCLEAEFGTRNIRRSILHHDRLLENWRETIGETIEKLDLELPRRSAESEARVDGFLTPDLKRNVVSRRDLDRSKDVFRSVTQTYDALVALADSRTTDTQRDLALATLDEIRNRFDEVCRAFDMSPGGGDMLERQSRQEDDTLEKGDADERKPPHRQSPGPVAMRELERSGEAEPALGRGGIADAFVTAMRREDAIRDRLLPAEELSSRLGADELEAYFSRTSGRDVHRMVEGGCWDRFVRMLVPGRRRKRRNQLRTMRQAVFIRETGFFDAVWYLKEYPDVAAMGIDPVIHYLSAGADEGRNPSAAFDTAGYVRRYPDVGATDLNPFVHFLSCGIRENRDPTGKVLRAGPYDEAPAVGFAAVDFPSHRKQRDLHRARLVPLRQLEMREDGGWTSLGADPQFLMKGVSGPLPYGWVQVELDVSESRPFLDPVIYISRGKGFAAKGCIALGAMQAGRVQRYAWFPRRAKELRFDPMDGRGSFRIASLTIRKVGFFHVLKKAFQSKPAVVLRAIRKGLSRGRAWKRSLILDLLNKRNFNVAAAAYQAYVERTKITSDDIVSMRRQSEQFAYKPVFSIVVPVYNVEERWLSRCVESVLAQAYPHWELCMADDASTEPHVRRVLERYAQLDSRIRVTYRAENGRISRATNSAMDLATGDFICLMDNDDEITANALFEFARLLNEDPAVDMIYSDEDKMDLEGRRYEPFFKPDWSPESLEGCMYTAHFACYRTKIAKEIGGFRSEFDGAQDYDFVLRFVEKTQNIRHVPKVLYHWRAIPGSTAFAMDQKNYVIDAAVRALQGRVERVYGEGWAKAGFFGGSFEIRAAIKGEPLISVVIASAGQTHKIRGKKVDLLANCVNAVRERSTYKNVEIIVVDNNDLSPSTKKALDGKVDRFIHYELPFNYAAKANLGARAATGDFLVFLNDDIDVISEDWIEAMLNLGQRPEIGVVGTKLHYEDGSLQHVGVAFCDGFPDHIFSGFPEKHPGHFFSSVAVRNYTAVTGACMMIRREVFDSVSGFDENLAYNYNDIDLCLAVRRAGYRVVWTPHARLYHYESMSRERSVSQHELDLFAEKWRLKGWEDPYYSPLFSAKPPNFMLAFPDPG